MTQITQTTQTTQTTQRTPTTQTTPKYVLPSRSPCLSISCWPPRSDPPTAGTSIGQPDGLSVAFFLGLGRARVKGVLKRLTKACELKHSLTMRTLIQSSPPYANRVFGNPHAPPQTCRPVCEPAQPRNRSPPSSGGRAGANSPSGRGRSKPNFLGGSGLRKVAKGCERLRKVAKSETGANWAKTEGYSRV